MALEINSEKLIESFDKLTGSLEKLEKQIQDTGKDVSAFDKLFGSTKNFDDFVTSIKRIGNVSTDSFKVIADGISNIAKSIALLKGTESGASFAVFSTLPAAFKNIQVLAKDTSTITAINALAGIIRATIKLSQAQNLTEAITNVGIIGKIVDELSEQFAKLDSLKSLNPTGVTASINSISALINGVARLSEVDLTGVTIPQGFTETLRELLNIINGLPNSSEKKSVGIFQDIVGNIAKIITGPIASAGAAGAKDIASTLASVARAMQAFSKVNLDGAKISQIAKSFGKLGLAFQAIGFVLKFIPGGKELGEFSKTIQRLGIGLASLSRASGALDVNAIKKLIVSLTLLGVATKILSKLLNFGRDKSVEAFAKVIGSIATAMNALSSLNKIQIQDPKSVDKLISPMIKIIVALRKLKGVKVEGLGEVVKGIGDIIKTVTLPDAVTDNLDKVPGVVERVVNSLSRLNGIRSRNAGGGLVDQRGLAGSVRNGLLQAEVIRRIADSFAILIQSSVRFETVVLSAFKRAGQEAQNFGQNLIQMAQKIEKSLSLNALQQSEPFNIAQEFERTSSLLQAAGLNDAQLQLAQDFADTIGIQYPLSANQALDAILELTRAGRDLSEVQFILPNASNLAALAEGDLEGVTRTLIGVAGAFQQFTNDVEGGFSTIETATNLISAAADVGTSTVASLSDALANVGPSANAAGLTLEETLAILTQFEDANIRGAEAGTQLRSVLNSLASPRARDELRRLGVTTVNADGSLRDLNDIIVDINNAYETLELTESQRQLSINQLADSYARQGLNVLLLRDGFQATVDAMGNSATAADKAQQSMDNLAGDTEQLRGSLETLYKDILYPLINRAFRPLTQVALQFVNALLKIPDPIKDVVSVMVQLLATFGSIAAVVLTVVGALSVLGGGVLSLVSNIGLLILRLPILIAGIGSITASLIIAIPIITALGLAFVGISTYASQFYRVVEENIGGAGDAFERFKTTVGDVFSEISRIFQLVSSVFDEFFGEIFGNQTIGAGERVTGLFDNLNNTFKQVLDTIRQISRSDIVQFFSRLSPFIRGFLNSFSQLGEGVFNLITGNFELAGEQIRRGASDIFSLLTDIVQRITNLNLGSVVSAFNEGDIRRGANELLHSVIRIFRNVIRQNLPIFNAVFQQLLQFINPFSRVGNLLDFLGLDGLSNVFREIGNQINSFLGGVFDTGLRLLSGERIQDIIGGSIGPALQRLFNSLRRLVQPVINLLNRFFEIFTSRASGFGEEFANQADSIGAGIETVARFLNHLAIRVERFLSPITENLPSIIENVERFAVSFIAAFQPLIPFSEEVFNSIGRVFDEFAKFLSGEVDLGAVAQQLTAEILNTIGRLPQTLGSILVNLGNVLQSSLLTSLGRAFQSGDIIGGIFNFLRTISVELFRIIPELFRTLGDALGLSFLTAIGDALSQGNIIRVAIIIVEQVSKAIQFVFDQIGLAINGIVTEFAGRSDPITGFFLRIFGGLARIILNVAGGIKTATLDFANTILRLVDLLGPIPVLLGSIGTAFFLFRTQIIQLAQIAITRLGGFSGILQSLRAGIQRFAGAVAVFSTFSSALDNIGKVLEGRQGIFDGFLNFLVDAGANFLRMTGLSDLFAALVDQLGNIFGVDIPASFDDILANVRVTVDQLGQIFNIFISNLARDFNRGVDAILISIQDAFHRAEIALGTQNDATTQFFAVGDALAAQATLTAQEFFGTLGAALENPQDIGTLNAQLRSGAEAIINEFRDFIVAGGRITDLAAQGLLDDFVNTLTASGTIGNAFAELSGNLREQLALFAALDFSQQADSLESFFIASQTGLESNLPSLRTFLDYLDRLVASGEITQEQANAYVERLTPATQDVTDATNEYLSAQQAQAQATQDSIDAATEYGYTLDGLAESFRDAELSAEEMGTRFRDVVSGLTAEEIDLAQLFDIYSQLSPEEAAASFGEFFEAAIRGGVSRAGNEEYFEMLQTQIDDLRNSGFITSEQRRTFLDQMALDARTASTALDETTSKLTNLQRLVQNSQARLDALRAAGKGNLPEISPVPPFDPNASGVDDYIDKQEEEIAEKIADFAKEEAKRLKDDLEEEKKAAEELKKLKYGVDQDELDRISDFNRDTERREQDHQIALQKIRDTAADALEDAIASRSSAAAQTALKERNKQLKDEEDKFRLDEQRRLEDEKLRIERYERERAEKILQAEQDLADLIAKNFAEREERKREFQDELNDLRAKNAEVNAQNQAAYQQVATTNAQTVANTVAAANSIRSALTNALNAVLSGAAGGGEKGKGGKGFPNKAGWSFDGLEEAIIYDDPSKKKKGSGNVPSPFNNGFSLPPPPSPYKKGGVGIQSFETGGRLPYTGIFMGHQDEQVLNRQQAREWRAGNTNTNNVTVSPQITVNAAPGMDTNALAQQIEQRIVTELQREIDNLPGGKV